jgi:Endonuclease/Exonuclease/phosphatase family
LAEAPAKPPRTPSAPARALRRLRASGTGGRLGQLAAVVSYVAVGSLIGVALSGGALAAPPAALAVAIALLPYLFGLLFALLVALAFAFPARRAFPVMAGVVLVVAGYLWVPRPAPEPAPDDGLRVKAASWNVRRLWGGPADGGDPTRCVIDGLQAHEPDIVTLLEVSAADVDKLTPALGLQCVHHTYNEGGDRTAGGLAVCVRGDRMRLGPGGGQRFVDEDDWYYVSAEVRAGDRVFNVLAVHLFPYRYVARTIAKAIGGLTRGETEAIVESGRAGELVARSQADHSAAMLARVGRFHDPTLIGGDFNSTRDSALHWSLRETLVDTWATGGEWVGPSVFLFDRLPLRVDYIYATRQFHTVSSVVPPIDCSDHRPVVSELVLERPTP